MESEKTEDFNGLATGLTSLDEKLHGLKASEMIVIAARPSVGKTSLALNIAESVALGQDLAGKPIRYDGGGKHPVAIFSLEMTKDALTKRMVAGRARVNVWRLNHHQIEDDERMRLVDQLKIAEKELSGAPIYVDDTDGLDITDLRAHARRMKEQHDVELIIIDYLQLCRCDEKAEQGRCVEISEISHQIKAMAKELRVPVIILSQLCRANELRGDKYVKPKLSDLRDSSAIAQDADVVMLLHRPTRNVNDVEPVDETLAIIDVAKNCDGETGEVLVNFDREYTRFGDRELP